jgi:propanediol dehydratase small subunit
MDGEPLFDPEHDYPIGQRRPDLVRTPSGRTLKEITVDAIVSGEIDGNDLRITPGALRMQAQVAARSGRRALVANFERAAELTALPDDRLLAIYEALRPGRSTRAVLEAIADELESVHHAPRCAALVREAIDAYTARGLFDRVPD